MDNSNTGGFAPQDTRGVTFFSRAGHWTYIPSRHFDRNVFSHDDPDHPELFAHDYEPGSVLIYPNRTRSPSYDRPPHIHTLANPCMSLPNRNPTEPLYT